MRLLIDELGFDAAVDYKADDWREQLRPRPRTGSTSTSRTSAARSWKPCSRRLNIRARVALCGLISGYNETEPPPGPRAFGRLLTMRVRLQGFIILDYWTGSPRARRPGSGWPRAGSRPGDCRRRVRPAPARPEHALRRPERRKAARPGVAARTGAGPGPVLRPTGVDMSCEGRVPCGQKNFPEVTGPSGKYWSRAPPNSPTSPGWERNASMICKSSSRSASPTGDAGTVARSAPIS